MIVVVVVVVVHAAAQPDFAADYLDGDPILGYHHHHSMAQFLYLALYPSYCVHICTPTPSFAPSGDPMVVDVGPPDRESGLTVQKVLRC